MKIRISAAKFASFRSEKSSLKVNKITSRHARIENSLTKESKEKKYYIVEHHVLQIRCSQNLSSSYVALPGSAFRLNGHTGDITVKPGASPDFEKLSKYNVTVTAEDTGNPPLSVMSNHKNIKHKN